MLLKVKIGNTFLIMLLRKANFVVVVLEKLIMQGIQKAFVFSSNHNLVSTRR